MIDKVPHQNVAPATHSFQTTFVQQCDTIERLKQHLLASSSSSSDLDQNSSSSDDGDEAMQTLRDLRQRLEAKLDQELM